MSIPLTMSRQLCLKKISDSLSEKEAEPPKSQKKTNKKTKNKTDLLLQLCQIWFERLQAFEVVACTSDRACDVL